MLSEKLNTIKNIFRRGPPDLISKIRNNKAKINNLMEENVKMAKLALEGGKIVENTSSKPAPEPAAQPVQQPAPEPVQEPALANPFPEEAPQPAPQPAPAPTPLQQATAPLPEQPVSVNVTIVLRDGKDLNLTIPSAEFNGFSEALIAAINEGQSFQVGANVLNGNHILLYTFG
ncbi:hypothetical protein CMI37_29805 [Candidatus Pacearchaeota archaeon]|jgi:predicted component of type VI protein secretion system|nr:hypothetical protein [Candidatus Pacearchaeota archaeon]|tara:strand:- start:416 stop:937 length:522 start_codon:yes stop_codon:yes gene_type:complete